MRDCQTRSPGTISGSAPAGCPWAHAFRWLAFERHACALSGPLHGRTGRVSSSSVTSPAPEHEMQPSIAEPPPFGGQIFQPFPKLVVHRAD